MFMILTPLMPVLSVRELPADAPLFSGCYVHEKRRVYIRDSDGWRPLNLEQDSPGWTRW